MLCHVKWWKIAYDGLKSGQIDQSFFLFLCQRQSKKKPISSMFLQLKTYYFALIGTRMSSACPFISQWQHDVRLNADWWFSPAKNTEKDIAEMRQNQQRKWLLTKL